MTTRRTRGKLGGIANRSRSNPSHFSSANDRTTSRIPNIGGRARMFANYIRKLAGARDNRNTRRAKRRRSGPGKLGLHILESRDLPAALTWAVGPTLPAAA